MSKRDKLDPGSGEGPPDVRPRAAGIATSRLRVWETYLPDNAREWRTGEMFDFTGRARSGFWVLQDAECGDLGAYETHEEALAAAGDWLRLIETPWPVLICDADGEWRQAIVEPTALH